MTDVFSAFEGFIEALINDNEKAASIAHEASLEVAHLTLEERYTGPFQTYGAWEDICAASWMAEAG